MPSEPAVSVGFGVVGVMFPGVREHHLFPFAISEPGVLPSGVVALMESPLAFDGRDGGDLAVGGREVVNAPIVRDTQRLPLAIVEFRLFGPGRVTPYKMPIGIQRSLTRASRGRGAAGSEAARNKEQQARRAGKRNAIFLMAGSLAKKGADGKPRERKAERSPQSPTSLPRRRSP